MFLRLLLFLLLLNLLVDELLQIEYVANSWGNQAFCLAFSIFLEVFLEFCALLDHGEKRVVKDFSLGFSLFLLHFLVCERYDRLLNLLKRDNNSFELLCYLIRICRVIWNQNQILLVPALSVEIEFVHVVLLEEIHVAGAHVLDESVLLPFGEGAFSFGAFAENLVDVGRSSPLL